MGLKETNRVLQGYMEPQETTQDNTGPHGTTGDHTGLYGLYGTIQFIQEYTGLYSAVRDHKGP